MLDVIVDNAESKSSSLEGTALATTEQQSNVQVSATDAEMNTDAVAASPQVDETSKVEEPAPDTGEPDVQNTLCNLPQEKLRLLCSLLAKEGYAGTATFLLGS